MPPSGWSASHGPLDFTTLRHLFHARQLTPTELVATLFRRIRACTSPNIWISLVDESQALARALELESLARAHGADSLPLFGIPFAVKDNIDVAGMNTTAACRDFAYPAGHSSPVVEKLLRAGAILLGKTNLDQFATGLTGLLSSFGPTRNPFNPEYISGGSSSGSGVAVAAGLVSFALGTDTAGSGRVPAAFNHLVGLKPTRGLCSTRGLFPACRSLDCISFLSLNVDDAAELLALSYGFDSADPYSRREAADFSPSLLRSPLSRFRYGVPKPDQLDFLGDASAQKLYASALKRLDELPGTTAQRIEVDIAPFLETGRLLYHGPWIAERLASMERFIAEHPDALHPVTRSILDRGQSLRATDVFRGYQQLAALRRQTESLWAQMDVLVLPTAPRPFTLAEASADPGATSALLGLYTNFANLLDLCALALPAGFTSAGLPWGISLLAPAFFEANLLAIGQQFFPDPCAGLSGAPHYDQHRPPRTSPLLPTLPQEPQTSIAVVGAHLSGQPLNHQLTELGARLLKRTRTAPQYRLYALANTTPEKPGLVRVTGEPAAAIELEVWSLPEKNAGAFLAKVPPPLCIGSILLDNGDTVKGFLCEPCALKNATDISHHAGWLHYLAAKKPQ